MNKKLTKSAICGLVILFIGIMFFLFLDGIWSFLSLGGTIGIYLACVKISNNKNSGSMSNRPSQTIAAPQWTNNAIHKAVKQHKTTPNSTSANRPYQRIVAPSIEARQSVATAVESQSHLRIINDTLSLIDKTTNIDTLNNRYALLLDEVDWVYAHGHKLSMQTKSEALEKIAANKNENLVRIATYTYNKVIESVKALKTDKGRKNAEAKAMQQLSQCIASLAAAPNKANSLSEITKLITGFSSAAPSVRTAALGEPTVNEGAKSVSEYRKTEQDRWQQNDTVVGYEIKLGTNKDHCDICEQLAGKYPKNFRWRGWYDGCRCYQVSILKTDDEFWSDLEKEPEERNARSKNEVADVPENFKQWVRENTDLIRQYEAEGTAPSFITDNIEIIERIIN